MSELMLPSNFVAAVRRNLPLLSQDETITEDLDLTAAGLDSLAMVNLLMEVEDEFAVTIPDDKLNGAVFSTPKALWSTISELQSTRVE